MTWHWWYIPIVIMAIILAVSVRNFFTGRRVPWFGRLERLRRQYDELDNPTWRVAIEDKKFIVTNADVRYIYPAGTGEWREAAALSEAIRRHESGYVSALTRYRNQAQEDSIIVLEQRLLDDAMAELNLELASKRGDI